MADVGLIGPEATARLKSRLLSERDELRVQINEELSKEDSADSANVIDAVRDRGEESVADLYSDLKLAGIERQVARLSLVEDALYRIDANEYGVCAECAEPVNPDRLDADPATTLCIKCQTRKEDIPSGKDVTPSL